MKGTNVTRALDFIKKSVKKLSDSDYSKVKAMLASDKPDFKKLEEFTGVSAEAIEKVLAG